MSKQQYIMSDEEPRRKDRNNYPAIAEVGR